MSGASARAAAGGPAAPARATLAAPRRFVLRTVTLSVIGVVRNGRDDPSDRGWGALESRIELEPAFAPGLAGLDGFSHAIVVFWMDGASDDEPPTLVRRPRGRADMPLLGVFAQRGRMRPNPVGVTTVPIVRLEPDALVVRGLDALDGTPVLDLKPHAPAFDRPESPRAPAWLARLMDGYF